MSYGLYALFRISRPQSPLMRICHGPNESTANAFWARTRYLNVRRLAIARCHTRHRHLTLRITPRENNIKDEQQNVLKGSEPGNVIHQRVDVVLR